MQTTQTLKIAAQGDQEIVMTRQFNAPRALVFEAFTKPDLLRRWLLGPPDWSMDVCEVDLRPGGTYRYLWRHADGKELGVRGTFREIVPPERIVHTERFDEAWYPGEALLTTVFTERGGVTALTVTIQYESREARDSVLRTGMERGVRASYDRLADLLAASAAG